VGLTVAGDTEAIRIFRLVLEEYQQLCRRRKQLEAGIVTRLAGYPDFRAPADGARDRTHLALSHPGGIAGPASLRTRPAITEILRVRSLHQAVRPISQDHASLETGQCPIAIPAGWLAPSRSGCNKTAFAGSLRMTCGPIPGMAIGDGSLHRRGGEDGPRRLRRDHLRHRLSSLPRADETRRNAV
jgi:hypothetical protein